ncbi:MAG: GntR family transcriptional regulator [Rhodospirillales bacterium]|nr:GntR family transcriptional regulator [Rhodospirillales bacterium]
MSKRPKTAAASSSAKSATRKKADDNPPEFLINVLRDRIANHDLPPGSKLRENSISEEFGVSRARVREAFGGLEERGLIERIPNRGAVVTRLEAPQVFELFAVREVLEGLAVRLATENQPPESWQDLVDLFDKPLEQAVNENDLEFYIEALATLRTRMVIGAESQTLESLLDSIYDRTRVLIRRLVILPGRARQGLKEHRAMLAAMRAGDAEKAEQLKRANIRGSRATFDKFQKFIL